MDFNIAILAGDGIGPEVTKEAVKVLQKTAEKFNHNFKFSQGLIGGAAYDVTGDPLPDETLKMCQESDSVLLGAVGGYKWDNIPLEKRPEKALLKLRGALGLYANLRPAIMYDALKDACALRPEVVKGGIDIMVVRELTGGIYFGERGEGGEGEEYFCWDTEKYSVKEIKRIAKTAFDAAMQRNKNVISIDKSNVLRSSRLWRETVNEVAKDYPEVNLSHMYVDNAAMQLIRDPKQFDVILTNNIFGDILSDEASQITGSIGLLPSASLNADNFGMYEPIHGSAPDIAGQNIANPVAAILSAAMMLKYSFDLNEESKAIEEAVEKVLNEGYRTSDIMAEGMKRVSTEEMGSLIAERL